MLLLNKRPLLFFYKTCVLSALTFTWKKICTAVNTHRDIFSRNTNIAILIIIRKIYDNFFLDTENRNRSEKLKSNKVDKKWIKRPQGQMQIGETWTLVSFCSADLSMTVSFISCSFLFICVHFAVKDDGCFQRLD